MAAMPIVQKNNSIPVFSGSLNHGNKQDTSNGHFSILSKRESTAATEIRA